MGFKKMKYLYCLFILSFLNIGKLSSEELNMDLRGYIENEKMTLGQEAILNHAKLKATWHDSKGNYGKSFCFGMVLLNSKETRIEDMVYCEFLDQENEKFWTRAERTGSNQQAGIGELIFFTGTEKYSNIIGKRCVYAVSYMEDSFHTKLKCKI